MEYSQKVGMLSVDEISKLVWGKKVSESLYFQGLFSVRSSIASFGAH